MVARRLNRRNLSARAPADIEQPPSSASHVSSEEGSEMTGPRSPAPAPASPPDDDDLLREIVIRLPPHQPSSLPRASLVCTRWRGLVSDPLFLRQFRARHHFRDDPPLLGCFYEDFANGGGISFIPTLDPPDRVWDGRFSLKFRDCCPRRSICCRHGLVLVFHIRRLELLVWDPVTGDQHQLPIPQGFQMKNGAVLRTAAGAFEFEVVLVGYKELDTRVVACVYSSRTGVWGSLVSITVAPTDNVILSAIPSVMVGDSLYWMYSGDPAAMLEFDLVRQSLATIQVPVDMYVRGDRRFWVMRAEGGGVGFLLLTDSSAQLWKRTADCDGAASWSLAKTIQLDKLLSQIWIPIGERKTLSLKGFSEDTNVMFLETPIGHFMVQLESLQSKKLPEISLLLRYHPFTSVYTAGMGIGGGHDGAERLHNT